MAHRIDTHIHIIPDAYRKVVESIGDPSGWHVPAWTPETALQYLDSIKVEKAVWSITSPGPAVAGSGPEVRKIVKDCNDETAAICSQQPKRFAYFASLPSFVDVEGTVEAIEYALTKLDPKPAGFVTMTSYSSKLLGDPAFDKIWETFHKHKAVVFIHPSSVDIKPKHIADLLPQPTIDYPLASSRTGVDLVLRGHVRKYSGCKIILSHAGGIIPFLYDRLIQSLTLTEVSSRFTSQDRISQEAAEDLKALYFDVAISTTRGQLIGLLEMADPSHILFGSDWPYGGKICKPMVDRWEVLLKTKEFAVLADADSVNAKRLLGW